MGIISDRTRSRFGRKRVYILFGAIPLALSFIALWLIPLGVSTWLRFLMAIAALLLYSTAYTVVVVPYMAMVPVMTGDYDERTRITGLRAMLSSLGTIIGGAAALLVSSFTDEALGLRATMIVFGVFTAASLLIAARSIKGCEGASHDNQAVSAPSWRQYLALCREKNLLVLLMMKFLGAIGTGTLSAALPYFAAQILGNKGGSTIGLAIYVIASAAAIPFWQMMTRSRDKRSLLLAGNILSAGVLLSVGLTVGEGSSSCSISAAPPWARSSRPTCSSPIPSCPTWSSTMSTGPVSGTNPFSSVFGSPSTSWVSPRSGLSWEGFSRSSVTTGPLPSRPPPPAWAYVWPSAWFPAFSFFWQPLSCSGMGSRAMSIRKPALAWSAGAWPRGLRKVSRLALLDSPFLVHRLRKQFYTWDEGALRRHQAARVERILAYARAHSPYYRRYLAGLEQPTLPQVPIIDKAEMMAHFDEINTAGLTRDPLVDFRIRQERAGAIGLYQGRFSVGLSSGTSGNKSLTVLSPKERALYACLLWARSGLPEGISGSRVLFTLRTNNPAFMAVNAFGIRLVYADYTKSVPELIGLINRERLKIIAGPPSLLTMLARERSSIETRIEALISYAEVLDPETRSFLSHAFSAPVSEIYQGAEGFVGSTCRHGKLHLNEDVLLVELMEAGDDIGGAKKVVVTDLYRTTQPIIRYALNDLLELSPERCRCGSCFRVIERIHGRADDIFHLRGPDGGTRYLFPDYVRRSINRHPPRSRNSRRSNTPRQIEIRLVLRDEPQRAAIEAAVLANLRWWAGKVGGDLGRVDFTHEQPERNPRSQKLIRVSRRYPDGDR